MPIKNNNSFGGSTFLGHPRGLGYLAFTELWERFSYYGMTSLLVLYMVQELLLPGHVENVLGLQAIRSLLESMFGPLSPQALASQLFGLYSGLVYFTPIVGGWLADRFFGARKMVLFGVMSMTAGHFAMAFEQSFLLALFLLIIGSGALKGNIATQVGHLYPADEASRRSRGFAIFSAFINIGAFCGPIVTGLLAQAYGWHVGFGFAGVLMLISIAVYVAGRKDLPAEPTRSGVDPKSLQLSRSDKKTLLLMLPVFLLAVLGHMAYFQSVNVGFVWIAGHVELATRLGEVPVPWFASVDPLAGILCAPLLIIFWRALARRNAEPDEIQKMGIGLALMALGMAIFAFGATSAGEERASVLWPLFAYVCTGIGFFWYWPVMLSFVSRLAPQGVKSLVMGVSYLSLFFAGLMAGYVGSLYESMSPASFFYVNAAYPAGGALLALLFGGMLNRAIQSQ
jgi:POT family proton-dependent oligopeptide transporter